MLPIFRLSGKFAPFMVEDFDPKNQDFLTRHWAFGFKIKNGGDNSRQ
jgi:hypothetical protein